MDAAPETTFLGEHMVGMADKKPAGKKSGKSKDKKKGVNKTDMPGTMMSSLLGDMGA